MFYSELWIAAHYISALASLFNTGGYGLVCIIVAAEGILTWQWFKYETQRNCYESVTSLAGVKWKLLKTAFGVFFSGTLLLPCKPQFFNGNAVVMLHFVPLYFYSGNFNRHSQPDSNNSNNGCAAESTDCPSTKRTSFAPLLQPLNKHSAHLYFSLWTIIL